MTSDEAEMQIFLEVVRVKRDIIELYPDFESLNLDLSSVFERVYPYKCRHDYSYNQSRWLHDLKNFKTYLFIMKEYHELWDL